MIGHFEINLVGHLRIDLIIGYLVIGHLRINLIIGLLNYWIPLN